EKICTFEYREMNRIDRMGVIKKFDASMLASLSEVKIFLLSALQNPKIWDYEIYNLDLLENNDKFRNLCAKMMSEKLVLVDTTNLTHDYIFVYGHSLKKYDLLNNYNLIKIRKSYLDLRTNETINACISNKINMWHKSEPLYCFNIENQVMFGLCNDEKFNNNNFYIFAEVHDFFTDLLARSLESLGGKPVPISDNKITALYISSECMQYTYMMPRFHEILLSETKFYLYDVSAETPIMPIFPDGGILSLDPGLLSDIDVPDLLNVLRTISDSNSKWALKIPATLISGLKKLMEQHKGRLSYNGIEEIYKIAEKNVEDDIDGDIEKYIKWMASKYFREKRFFIVLSDGCKGDFYKTPTDVFKKYLKIQNEA
ncbi:hypothetical protein EQH57_0523, partial [Dictyocoela roeselum]